MKKSISIQVKFMACMLVILTAVVFSAVFSAVNLNQIRQSSADMMQNYMQIQNVESSIHSALMVNRITSVICILCVVLTIILLQCCLLNPLRGVSEKMLQTARDLSAGRGNLTERIEAKRGDEIGRMQESINQLLEAFCNVTSKVKGNALYIEKSAQKTERQVEMSNDKLSGLSSVMEELTATSQEIAALTRQMNNEMHEIAEETSGISDEMSHGTRFSAELKERAGYIRQKTLESKKRTESIANSIKGTMEKSISDRQDLSGDVQKQTDICRT